MIFHSYSLDRAPVKVIGGLMLLVFYIFVGLGTNDSRDLQIEGGNLLMMSHQATRHATVGHQSVTIWG